MGWNDFSCFITAFENCFLCSYSFAFPYIAQGKLSTPTTNTPGNLTGIGANP